VYSLAVVASELRAGHYWVAELVDCIVGMTGNGFLHSHSLPFLCSQLPFLPAPKFPPPKSFSTENCASVVEKIKILKTPFTVFWNLSSFKILCQLQWNSTTVKKSVGILCHGNMGLGIWVIPIYVHSHSFLFPSWNLIPIPNGISMGFPFSFGISFPWSSLRFSVVTEASAFSVFHPPF